MLGLSAAQSEIRGYTVDAQSVKKGRLNVAEQVQNGRETRPGACWMLNQLKKVILIVSTKKNDQPDIHQKTLTKKND